jgi:hypothetical protein
MTLKMLSERVGVNIIAQELLELLVSQIMDHKTQELELDEQENPIMDRNDESQGHCAADTNKIPHEQIIAISEIDLDRSKLKKIKKEYIDSDDAEQSKMYKLNTRSIMNNQNFVTIMAITTLVPFIKTGIPRLSDFDVKEAKISEKDCKRKSKGALYSVKPFMENL